MKIYVCALCAALTLLQNADAFLAPSPLALRYCLTSATSEARRFRAPGILSVRSQAQDEITRRQVIAATGLQLAGLAFAKEAANAVEIPIAPTDRPST
eukprot:1810720-Rhodomonas_salina.1